MKKQNDKKRFWRILLLIYPIIFLVLFLSTYGIPPDFKTWRFGLIEFLFPSIFYSLPFSIVVSLLIRWAINKSRLIAILLILIIASGYNVWFLPAPPGLWGELLTLVPIVLLAVLSFVLLKIEVKKSNINPRAILERILRETSGLAIFSFFSRNCTSTL